MDRSPELQAHQGLTLYFLGKLHSGLKKLSAYYRQRGVKVFNVTTPEELERALSLSRPHALIIDLQSRSDITRFFEVLGQHEGLLELPRVAIISSTTDQDTAEALMGQADESVIWPLKATDLSLKLFNLLASRGQFVRFQRDVRDEDGRFYRGELYLSFLRDVLQLLYLGRKDAILSLESEGRRGNLYFKEGKLIDAQVGALEWEDSLSLVRRFKTGTFVLSFQPVDRKKFIEKNIAAWLAQQEEGGEAPSSPEPGEATAISTVTDAGKGDYHLPIASHEDEPTATGVLVGGRLREASSEVTTPTIERLAVERPASDKAPPADPLTTMPPPTTNPSGIRMPQKPVEPPAVARPAPTAAVIPPTPRTPPPPVEPVRPPPPPTPEARGFDRRIAIGLAILVALLLGVYVLRSPGPTQVVQLETPPPTPRPVAQPTPERPRVREIPAETPVAVAPIVTPPPEVQVKPTPPPTREPAHTEQRAPGVREIVAATPTPAPRPTPRPEKLEKPTPTPRPEKPPVQVKTEVKPEKTPAPIVATPTPAPTVVAMTTQPRVQEPPPADLGHDRPEKSLARKARELEKAGKLQEALALYTQVAELDPSSREASEAISRLKGGTAEVNPMAPGELHINSFPYGIVYVDGEKQGYTPVHLNKAIPRKYLIRVVNPDFGTCSTEVVIKPGERKWVQLRLDDNENCQRSKSAP